MATKRRGNVDHGRMAGGFVAVPWVVLDSPAWQGLSHPARSLLMEMARQLGVNNNGQLLASGAYLRKRGWTSNDVISRALRELVAVGFLHQTVQGHRPNKASWYAITWLRLGADEDKFDPGTEASFRRGAFMDGAPLPKPKPTKEQLYQYWDKKLGKNGAASQRPAVTNRPKVVTTLDRQTVQGNPS